jgi:hypothetical protein
MQSPIPHKIEMLFRVKQVDELLLKASYQTKLLLQSNSMVTTRSQARDRAAATQSNTKARKAPIFVIPAQKLDHATATVFVLNNNTLPTKKETTKVEPSSNRVMTRSMTKSAIKSAKVETWNTYTQQSLDQLKNAKENTCDARKERHNIWSGFVKHMLAQLEQQQTGDVENKTICATNIYKILGYMVKHNFMDFASSNSLKKFWDTTFAKEKELLADIENHYKNGKLTKETYTKSKKVIQLAQTYQILYETLVFPERAGGL